MSAIELSISTVLAERARRQPDTPAYSFIDHDVEPAGQPRRLTRARRLRCAEQYRLTQLTRLDVAA
jgi:acyl-CoA synthetase (AMP-forming)/AMP-acid ligase II